MFNICPVHSCHVMSCSAAPCAISTLDLNMLLKSALYVINLEQFIASLICDLVVEHVPLAEQLCSTCKHSMSLM
jgi:hypothetical protein